jgi:hypothetical protein
MVRVLSLGLMLAATSASAAPLALPSFENAAAELRANVAALRAAAVKEKAADIGPRLDQMAWDVQRDQQDCQRLRRELSFLLSRLRNGGRGGRPGPGNGRGGPDQNLRWEFQRFNQDLQRVVRGAQWRLSDLRGLSAEAQKDPALVGPAQRLSDAARWLKSDTGWLVSDARFAYFDLMRAGLTFEGMDLDRNSRDLDQSSQDLQSEADRLLAKVR